MELREEEKKIIDRINRSYDDNTQYVEASAKDWNCIVDLIYKNQKEIEDYKKFKKDIEDNIREIIKDLDEFDDYFFSVNTLKKAIKNSLNRLLEE